MKVWVNPHGTRYHSSSDCRHSDGVLVEASLEHIDGYKPCFCSA